MCGLVGFFGDLNEEHKKAFRDLLTIDVLRGAHSTGVALTDSANDVVTVKQVGMPHELLDRHSYTQNINGWKRMLMGHNRWATIGAINSVNAHPFTHGDITGCHNGTLSAQHLLPDSTEFMVDSENIVHSINKIGAKATLETLDGAFALTWYNAKDKTFNIARNPERELFCGILSGTKAIMYASEQWMLQAVIERRNLELEKDSHIYKVKTGCHLKFSYEGGRVNLKLEDFTPYVKPVTTPPALTYSNTLVGRRLDFAFAKAHEVVKVGSVLTLTSLDTTDKAMITVTKDNMEVLKRLYKEDNPFSSLVSHSVITRGERHYHLSSTGIVEKCWENVMEDEELDQDVVMQGYKGEVLTKGEWEKNTDKGCAWCGDIIKAKDAEDILFLGKDEVVCPDCANEPEVKQYIKAGVI